MDGTTQVVFNIIVGVAAFLGGFWMKAMWEALKELREADMELTSKVHNIETLVVGEYVKWDGLREVTKPIMDQLRRIEDKLDGKVDKPLGK